MTRLFKFLCVCAALLPLGCNAVTTTSDKPSTAAPTPNLTMSLPSVRNIDGQNSFNCRSLMDTDLTGSYDDTLTQGLEGRVAQGVNNVSASIEGPTLLFLSESGFSASSARGAEFQIVTNSAAELVATFFDGTSVNSFVLNKTNGLAIWSKIRSTFPIYDAPTGNQSYLVCQ